MKSKRKILAYLILFHHLIYMLRRCKNATFTNNVSTKLLFFSKKKEKF